MPTSCPGTSSWPRRRATVSYGEGAHAEFLIDPLTDGTRLVLGEVVLEIRATPGHTPESISVVVFEHADAEPWGVLTGDALFIGDVGRPDLLASVGLDARAARPAALPVTAGQALDVAGRHAGSRARRWVSVWQVDVERGRIVHWRATSHELCAGSDERGRVRRRTHPGAVRRAAVLRLRADANRRGHALLDDHEPVPGLDWPAVAAAQRAGAVLIDGRIPEVFASGHVRGSINVSLDGRFAEYAGDVARPDQPIVVVTDAGRETEARVRLARIGFDNVRARSSTSRQCWPRSPTLPRPPDGSPPATSRTGATKSLIFRSSTCATPRRAGGRSRSGGHADPLAELARPPGRARSEPPDSRVLRGRIPILDCGIAAARHGFERVADILGGFEAWRAADLLIEHRDAAPVDVDRHDHEDLRRERCSHRRSASSSACRWAPWWGRLDPGRAGAGLRRRAAKAATATSSLLVGPPRSWAWAHTSSGRVRLGTGIAPGLTGVGGSILGTAINRRLDPNGAAARLQRAHPGRRVAHAGRLSHLHQGRGGTCPDRDADRRGAIVRTAVHRGTVAKVFLAGPWSGSSPDCSASAADSSSSPP